ncbi:BMP family lipoprotein [Ruegeria lacuscaerulensis]|uniref:BMP family lipoprotein n=1 Tax=Ruegeria lacuscaerulensis TaxID=55218 RepID=UPI00147E6D76|nr:BMP family protein [Ruegeria lacuscaerulensis]
MYPANLLNKTKAAVFGAAASVTMLAGGMVMAQSDVNIALMYSVGPESGWDKVVEEALDRVGADNKHGLNVSYDSKDAVYGEEAETVMNLLAKSGKYDIIISATAHSDQIKNLQGKYPDTMFVSLGSGNYNTGPNHYLLYGRVHEAAYLLGMLGAGMSETGVLGAVGSFPADDINDQLNAYKAGAQAVNPDAKVKISFIESWYDPQLAIEATYAQNAAGADVVYQLAGEVYEACRDRGILCFGLFQDTNSMAPDVVLSGTELIWDPAVEWVLDEWVKAKSDGGSFNGNTEPVWFGLADGGSDISPYHDLADKVPADLKDQIEQAKADIIAGTLEVPLVLDVPASD